MIIKSIGAEKGKFDPHNHLLIGFQPLWQHMQKLEPYSTNLADILFRSAINKKLTIVSITSEEFEIPINSVHDRFNYIFSEAERDKRYDCEKLGEEDIALRITRKEDALSLIVLNSQTVIVQDGDERLDHLVLGSNQVLNCQCFQDTIKYCKDHGFPQIAEHPFYKGHYGIGQPRLIKHLKDLSAIEGHNSQLILPGKNKKAIKFAEEANIPWVASSDAHSPSEVGRSYIEFNLSLLSTTSERNLLQSIQEIIESGAFTQHKKYTSTSILIKQLLQFRKGMSFIKKSPGLNHEDMRLYLGANDPKPF